MNKSMAEVERTQAELDRLYGELSNMAGGPVVAKLMNILKAADMFLEEARDRALALEHAQLGSGQFLLPQTDSEPSSPRLPFDVELWTQRPSDHAVKED